MKQTIIYRPFMNLEVKQDIDDMTYNITDISKIYLHNTGKRKDVSDFMSNKTTNEYQELLSSIETGKVVSKVKRGKFAGTWVCQELLIDFMMWVSPEFKHMAINFVMDGLQLAGKRNELKEGYKKMSKAIANSNSANFREEATMINVLCTGSCANNQRARLNIDKMKQMDELQITNANLIKAGLPLDQRKDILAKSL